MTFRFKMRLLSAIVAHSYNGIRTFFTWLDETLTQCANDAEMSFVCAHINVSLAGRCLDCVIGKTLRPVEDILKISPANTCALPQPKLSAFARMADERRAYSVEPSGTQFAVLKRRSVRARHIHCPRESGTPVPETQSALHPRARRTAFRHRAVRVNNPERSRLRNQGLPLGGSTGKI